MHVTCIWGFFSFSKAVLHNIMKLLSLGQLLQQFTLDTTAVRSVTPRRSEQTALQRRQLNLGDRLNRNPFLLGEGWGRIGVGFKKRINKKRKKNQTRVPEGKSSRCGNSSSRKGQAKTWRTALIPSPLFPKNLWPYAVDILYRTQNWKT